MIRPITPADTPALVAVSHTSGLFKPDELDAIHEMLYEYHAANAANDHPILPYEDGGALVGMAYFVPKPFTDRVWELLMISAPNEAGVRRGPPRVPSG